MGFWKFGTKTKIVEVHHNINNLVDSLNTKGFSNFGKRIAAIEPIKLDPERYIYIRNRSISAEEWYGPNENGDGFPNEELKTRNMTFVGCRLSVDHQDDIIIGMVLDSLYIPPQFRREGDKDVFVDGGYVENVLAIDKKAVASSRFPLLVDWIEDGKITDTSMGCFAGETQCSICGNIATNDEEYCDHILPGNGFKGTMIKTSSGEEKLCYESCFDITFFEDSIIVPQNLGGLAGGEGADPDAKMIERLASFPLNRYIVDRKKQIERISQSLDESEVKEDTDVYKSALDFLITKMKQEDMAFPEAFSSACEAFDLDNEIVQTEEKMRSEIEERFKRGSLVYITSLDTVGKVYKKVSACLYEVKIEGKTHLFDEEDLI